MTLVIARRKGKKVRYQDTETGKITKWQKEVFTPETAKVAEQIEEVATQIDISNPATLSLMTVAELRSIAADNGIHLPSKARKADLIDTITREASQ